jgi:hypothetical protein
MMLLHTGSLGLQYFDPEQIPDYVILSHRWGSEELSFEDVTEEPLSNAASLTRKKKGFGKIEGACNLAARDGYDWIWIDSCCIDKSSSAELQETINSMWKYYAESNICYVYMADVPSSAAGRDQMFQESTWFTRGWTLQELLAPISVEFYAQDWSLIGTKLERHAEIAEITNIDPDVLTQDEPIDIFSTAERLSWAAHREVTREEDVAYSLLGLFDVNMPMLYGEGRYKAFTRLQEAIFNTMLDHSIFLFSYSSYPEGQPLLAESPTQFCQRTQCTSCNARGIRCFPPQIPYNTVFPSSSWNYQAHEQILTTVTATRHEVSITVPLIDYQLVRDKLIFFDQDVAPFGITHLAVLNHTVKKYADGAFCLLLSRSGRVGDAYQRTNYLPALLPNIQKSKLKLQKTRILVCPGPALSDQSRHMIVTFALASRRFIVHSWSAKRVDQYQTAGDRNMIFKITTTCHDDSKSSAEVSSVIGHSQNPALQISLRLVRTGEIWSIKEIFEMTIRKQSQQQQRKRLLSSPKLCDRCSIHLSDGTKLSIGLRRLAASGRVLTDNTTPQARYQIVVDCAARVERDLKT